MPEKIKGREARAEDESPVVRLLRLLRSTYSAAMFAARLRNARKQGYQTRLTCMTDTPPAGFLGYRTACDLFWGRTHYIDDLIVEPIARGQGFGRALLADALAMARTAGFGHVRLASALHRTQTHQVYRNNGLHVVSYQFTAPLPTGA